MAFNGSAKSFRNTGPMTVSARVAIFALAFAGFLPASCGDPRTDAPPGQSEYRWIKPKPRVAVGPGAVRVTLPKARVEDRSKPLRVSYAFEGLPPGSWLQLALIWDQRPSGRFMTGPLKLEPIAVAGSGSGAVSWDTLTVGCAPNDGPTLCAVGNGRYRIAALVYDQPESGVPSMIAPEIPPILVARGESGPLELAGDGEYAGSVLALTQTARGALWRDPMVRKSRLPPGLEPFLENPKFSKNPFFACMRFEVRPPLRGHVQACGQLRSVGADQPREIKGRTWTSQKLAWRDDDLQPAVARSAALAALRRSFSPLRDESNSSDGRTWTTSGPHDGRYRPDRKSWALFFSLVRRYPADAQRDPDIRSAQVIVDWNGQACVAEIVEPVQRFTRALDDPGLACPASGSSPEHEGKPGDP